MAGDGLHECALRHQGRQLLGKVAPQFARTLATFIDQAGPPIDHGDDIFQIMAEQIVALASTVRPP
jgi:hypothetical protein